MDRLTGISAGDGRVYEISAGDGRVYETSPGDGRADGDLEEVVGSVRQLDVNFLQLVRQVLCDGTVRKRGAV